MRFSYRALDRQGKPLSGEIEARSPRGAGRVLEKRGLTVVAIETPTVASAPRRAAKPPKAGELALLLHQLVTLLEAGIALDEAVDSLARTQSHPFIAQALRTLGRELRGGASFSQALRASRLPFPAYVHQLGEAGELIGDLPRALKGGLAQMEYENAVATDIRNALIYPAILVVSGLAAVLFIFILVVPKFSNLLTKSHGDLPWLSTVILTLGQWVNQHLLLAGAGVALAAGLAVLAWRHPGFRQRCRDWLAEAPLIGPWLREAEIGRWATMLATLLGNRVDLLKALELAAQGVGIGPLRDRLARVGAAVRQGAPLSKALEDQQTLSAMGYNLVRVGERSGQLPAMLRSLAQLHLENGRQRMKRFLILLEPIAILTIGVVIGLIMIGIILAITSVNEIQI